MKFVIALFLSFIVQLNFVLSVNQKPKIAIIGSGIGGAACGLFLNTRLGRTVEIHIYEANKQDGGRINSITHKGNVYELGAQTILKEDKSTTKYVNFFELKKVNVNKNKSTYAVYDGQKLTQMNTVHKLADGYRITEAQYQTFSTKVEDKKNNFSYKTALDMLKLITTANNFILHSRVHECLNQKFYASDIIVKECEALLLKVYGQLDNVPALPGYFTVKSVQSEAYSIQGGNIQLVEKFLSRTQPHKTYRETVVSIRSIPAINKRKKRVNYTYASTQWKEFDFQITSVDEKQETKERNYDYVVVATSLTENMKYPIKFLDFSENIIVKGKFHKKFITIVEGDLESHYFNDNKDIAEKAGNIIFHNRGNIDFISKLGSVKVEDDNKSLIMNKKEDGASTSNKKKSKLFKTPSKKSNNKKDMTLSEIGVWKIQSKGKLSEEEIQKLFHRRTIIAEKEWLAYPNYKEYNLDKNDRFELRYGLYYINCIEWIASSIEMSIIGAKNIATQIADTIFIPSRK